MISEYSFALFVEYATLLIVLPKSVSPMIWNPPKHFQTGFWEEPILTIKQSKSVLKSISPFAGATIALRCKVVTLGNLTPWFVLFTSKIAFVLGLVVPIPTWQYKF